MYIFFVSRLPLVTQRHGAGANEYCACASFGWRHVQAHSNKKRLSDCSFTLSLYLKGKHFVLSLDFLRFLQYLLRNPFLLLYCKCHRSWFIHIHSLVDCYLLYCLTRVHQRLFTVFNFFFKCIEKCIKLKPNNVQVCLSNISMVCFRFRLVLI